MSKFSTYEGWLSLQKYLKDSLPLKEIARHMDKIQLRSPEKCVITVRTLPLVTRDFPSMPVKTDLIAERKRSMEMSVPVNQIVTVDFVSPVIHTAQTSWKKSVWQDFECHMSVMAVKRLVSVSS